MVGILATAVARLTGEVFCQHYKLCRSLPRPLGASPCRLQPLSRWASGSGGIFSVMYTICPLHGSFSAYAYSLCVLCSLRTCRYCCH
ncbi:hypothetical protein P171DRAFT_85910 [Karstenula rhodostoma CBS 690.94]|uniref:Uncharacterized protein n=1 Tax=Karstenula rhodostoma CBS 690.94 TaxID=1392251 RepID=A0A9P4U795_9PLEO|nr:hypothetical protein P171DRAFT_85910 [Karstenula rhodostoma CBS 690.94]